MNIIPFHPDENVQKSFLIYLKNWYEKLPAIKDHKKLENIKELLLQTLVTFISSDMVEGVKIFFEDIISSMLIIFQNNNLITVDDKKNFYTLIINDISSAIKPDLPSKRVRYLLIIIEIMSSNYINIYNSTNEQQILYNLILRIIGEFYTFDYIEKSNDESHSIKNK